MRFKTFVLSLLFLSGFAHGGKKILIFEDAETLGKGGIQNENYLVRTEPKTTEFTFNLTLGLLEKVDIGINLPFEYSDRLNSSNASLDLKWKFFEMGETKGAFKLSSEVPTKDRTIRYGPTLALQTSLENLSFYAVASYEFREKEFTPSASIEWEVTEGFSLVATGLYNSVSKGMGMIGGFSISKKNLEFALGVQKVFNGEKPSVLGGLTVRLK